VPAPFGGVVKELRVKVGDKVSEGSIVLVLEVEAKEATTATMPTKATTEKVSAPPKTLIKEILVPDIGAYKNVEVIEVSVSPGDVIKVDTGLITLETEKAALEVPSPFGGIVKDVRLKVGDKISEGSLILTVETNEAAVSTPSPSSKSASASTTSTSVMSGTTVSSNASHVPQTNLSDATLSRREGSLPIGPVHAGPGVRRFARELGVDLSRVRATGPKNRLLKIDIQSYVKGEMQRIQSGVSTGGMTVAPWPQVDFAKFGEISKEPLSRIKKLSGSFLHRNWVRVPHITQFDEADITDLEKFRKEQQPIAEKEDLKLTPLIFIMKAVVAALKAFPNFNSSIDDSGIELILKKYFHIGVAVDTPNGLVVPIIRDVDKKSYLQLAKELAEVSQKARAGQLTGQDMQGSSFSISSLGGIGGTAFTPIINVPDVAILGVSKSQMKPVYDGNEFKPRLLLPLSLSYDHRVIDGAEAARFITSLSKQLGDIRQLLA
jgi:pyruvate dehydrogenase E2 component (dihydrolipoamide acetyltransferase)